MIEGIVEAIDGLDTRRIIDMRHSRDLGTQDLEFLDSEERLLLLGHLLTALLDDVGDEEHVRAVAIHLEPIRDLLTQHGRREGTKGLAELDLEVHRALHGRRARIADDTPGTKRSRAELHTALEPADDVVLRDQRGDPLDKLSL